MIALDAMGGDFAPEVAVHGALAGARHGIPVLLYGDAMKIIDLLDSVTLDWRYLPLEVVHCTEVIGMDDEPTRAVAHKKNSSLVRAVTSLTSGEVDAVVTAGNSGAALVAGTLLVGRTHGVLRPALAHFLPTKKKPALCLDLGANVDCKATYLEQFAILGLCYAQVVAGIKNPRIALISNGHEPYKGSAVVKDAFSRLAQRSDLHFIGNIEPRDIFNGDVDVIVCDGFTGNIMLKTIQGTLHAMSYWLKEEAASSWMSYVGLGLAREAFNAVKRKTDYARAGGALLLGLKKPLIVAHGCSSALAIEQAILFAHQVITSQRVDLVNAELTKWLGRDEAGFMPAADLGINHFSSDVADV